MSPSLVRPESRVRLYVFSVVLTLFLLPVTVFAEDDQSIATLRRMGKAFTSISGKASPAVVAIRATKIGRGDSRRDSSVQPYSPFDEDLFEYFFRRRAPRQYTQQPQPKQVAQGSGFLVTADGYILTNNHMVGDAEDVQVQLDDRRTLKAKVIGTDPETDVAVIKIDATDLPYVELADSDCPGGGRVGRLPSAIRSG